MDTLKIVVILGVTCLVNIQGVPVSEPSAEKDEGIARNLQAPSIQRQKEVDYSSYFPINYDVVEPQETEETSVVGVPSSMLQPPSIDAAELYSTMQDHELNKELPTHQFLPLPVKSIAFFQPQQPNPTNQFPSTLHDGGYYPINPLSKQLDLPLPNAPTQTFAPPPEPAGELQLPIYQPFLQFRPHPQKPTEENQSELPTELQLPHLSKPQPFYVSKDELVKPNKQATKTFPKKYNSNVHEPQYKKPGKKISVIEVGEDYDLNTQISGMKPERFVYEPQQRETLDLEDYLQDKKIDSKRAKFEEVQKKILQKKDAEEEQQKMIDATRARAAMSDNEPITSETGFNSFGVGSSFVASPHHVSQNPVSPIGLSADHHGAGDDRTEFQMHGQHGPHSYKFGYDTGKGKSRQFRYEERDNDGYVKGHYGFYDKYGKLQVINYDAHPHHGFHAEGSFGKV